MNAASVKLNGGISEISRPGLYIDHVERVTVLAEGAEPLYAATKPFPMDGGAESGRHH